MNRRRFLQLIAGLASVVLTPLVALAGVKTFKWKTVGDDRPRQHKDPIAIFVPYYCCYIENGKKCDSDATLWLGTNGVDDYTHSCPAHAVDLLQDGDSVFKL